MTTDPATDHIAGRRADRLGDLGRRLVLAFAAVAFAAVALVTVAALIGTDRGLADQVSAQQQDVATAVAEQLAPAYAAAGGWAGADLSAVRGATGGTGTRLTVLDAVGVVVLESGMGRHGQGGPLAAGHTEGRTEMVSAPVLVGGAQVGTVALTYSTTLATTGRPVAWSWVLGAAAVALALAVAAGLLVTRRLTRPLLALTEATRSFAAGDRSARPTERGPGELGEVAQAFDEAASAVQAVEANRRQMAADVAHELRTPLAALQAGLEELRDGLVPADGPTLARLHDQSLRLGRVVADLAELSAAEAAGQGLSLAVQPMELSALVADECAARAAELRAAGLELHTELAPGIWVQADPERMHQVVGNLVQNCVRYCEAGDVVTVSATRSDDAAHAVLTVTDTGPGIAAEDLPHVLTRFWRSRTARNRSVGSGLGLAIVAELVRAHHGQIDVTSPATDDVRGTLIRVVLPAYG